MRKSNEKRREIIERERQRTLDSLSNSPQERDAFRVILDRLHKLEDAMETAWVIESENGYFISRIQGPVAVRLGWVHGHENALRFNRRQDAETILEVLPWFGLSIHENAIGVNEHIWYADGYSPAAPPPAEASGVFAPEGIR